MGSKKEDLLDPKTMDGPKISYAFADLLKSHPKLYMTYHVAETPFGPFSAVGALLGGLFYGAGFRRFPSALATMGTFGLVTGCGGAVLGLARLSAIASKGEDATPPWNDEGIQQRVNGLGSNFKVRVLDLSLWCGIGLAAGTLLVAGGPSKLKLSAGALGVLQAISLGSAVGSLGAIGCIYQSLPGKDEDKDED